MCRASKEVLCSAKVSTEVCLKTNLKLKWPYFSVVEQTNKVDFSLIDQSGFQACDNQFSSKKGHWLNFPAAKFHTLLSLFHKGNFWDGIHHSYDSQWSCVSPSHILIKWLLPVLRMLLFFLWLIEGEKIACHSTGLPSGSFFKILCYYPCCYRVSFHQT